jgi:hypothetical protein
MSISIPVITHAQFWMRAFVCSCVELNIIYTIYCIDILDLVKMGNCSTIICTFF